MLVYIWVMSRNCRCLVTWFCYQLIAKPGNKTATVSWHDPYHSSVFQWCTLWLKIKISKLELSLIFATHPVFCKSRHGKQEFSNACAITESFDNSESMDISYQQNHMYFEQMEAKIKWPTFCRRHFQMGFLGWKYMNFDWYSLKFVPISPINIPALVQIIAWRQPGDKPLSEPMMVSLLMHICVTRPQWVNLVN